MNNMTVYILPKEIRDGIINSHEKYTVEFKECKHALPKSIWETYSSFSNTSGGIIILGVKEGTTKNTIVGVDNTDAVLKDFWNLLSNKEKVNYRNVSNEDVNVFETDEGRIITIFVKEAADNYKPIYTSGNMKNTYIRTGDGDRRATEDEIRMFVRNSSKESIDGTPTSCTFDDLDPTSVALYKSIVSSRYPSHNYNAMSDEDFLKEIGAYHFDIGSREYRIKEGTILFLGKYNVIKTLFPQFHLDYFNRRGGNPRWIDRISDDEPNDYEMNIFNFYRLVHEKLKALTNDSFELDKETQLRLPVNEFDDSLREALVNCLAHADYAQGYPSIKVEAYDGWFNFINPGKLLIPVRQFVLGGDSRPRNETIMKLFRPMGASERQGFGGPLIYKTAAEYQFRRPEIITDLEHTELKIWNIDLADSYPDLDKDEKSILRTIMKNSKPLSVYDIMAITNIGEYKARKTIKSFTEREDQLLEKIGNGRGTKYRLLQSSEEKLTQLQIAIDMIKATIK